MKLKSKLMLICGILSLLCLVGWTGLTQKQDKSRDVWEYKILPYTRADEKEINALGSQGWELIVSEGHTSSDNRGSDPPTLYFKRKK